MHTLHRALLRFCLWQMNLEHAIGHATGMNPTYLARLRYDITRMEGDLLKLEVSNA